MFLVRDKKRLIVGASHARARVVADSLRNSARPDREIRQMAEARPIRPERLVDQMKIALRAQVATRCQATLHVAEHAVTVFLPLINDGFNILGPVEVRNLGGYEA